MSGLWNRDSNSTFLIGLFEILNVWIHDSCLEQHLAHKEHYRGITHHYLHHHHHHSHHHHRHHHQTAVDVTITITISITIISLSSEATSCLYLFFLRGEEGTKYIFISFLLLTLGLSYPSFFGFLRKQLRLLILALFSVLIYVHNDINFPLSTAFISYHKF